uniref:Uncharacterized protein n=1 Tax=Acrobeloides nanus TaxID=290746 RepID=A0A914C762_9BILA
MVHHGDYSCCGCMHVRTGALVIGILVIIGGIFGIIGSILNGIWPNIIGSAISIITGGLVIFADRTEREWGYLPYLVLNGIGIIIYTLVAIAFIIFGIVVPSGIEDWFKGINKNDDWKTAPQIKGNKFALHEPLDQQKCCYQAAKEYRMFQ